MSLCETKRAAALPVLCSRVKGEMEQRILSLGYKSVVIAQHSPRRSWGDLAGGALAQRVSGSLPLIPAQFRPVQARAVAEGAGELVARALATEHGSVILPSREMHDAASN